MGEFTEERLVDYVLGLRFDPELENAVSGEGDLRQRCHDLRAHFGSLDREFGRVLANTARDPFSRGSWRILVAVDDSPGSRTATLAAATLATRNDGVVEVLHVLGLRLGSRPRIRASEAEAVAVVQTALAELRSRGLTARGQLRRASPGRLARSIVWEAEEIRADVIVLGSTRRSRLSALGKPRVTAGVVRRSCCPVLIAR